MPDIFLSYASDDVERMRSLVRALERHGWTVWWDRTSIPIGQTFDRVIEEALDAARCVIVVWSDASVQSHWVRAEAEAGRERGLLIPVAIDEVQLPLSFRFVQTAQLAGWQGDESHEEFRKTVMAVTERIGVPSPEGVEGEQIEPPDEVQTDVPLPGEELSGSGLPEVEPQGLQKPPRHQTAQTSEIALPPHQSKGDDISVTSSLGMEFVRIPAGTFQMGSNDGYDYERPVHQVTISQPFELGKYPVTQAQWEAVMGNNPSEFTGDPTRPGERVSWRDVQRFIKHLNARDRAAGVTYRLPTEAEWEYAARAGTTTAYSFGGDPAQLDAYGWYGGNSGGTTHPVGQKQPNPWRLYDMHGNVWEWVQNWFDSDYYSRSPATDPQGPDTGSRRVFRGGSWGSDAWDCRSAIRNGAEPGNRLTYLGFRLLRQVR
jgi:formylglycine-generating enzyme required for sulfatase activity